MIVTTYDIPECREPLLYPLYLDGIRYRVPEMLELLISGRGRDKKTFAVTAIPYTDQHGTSERACEERMCGTDESHVPSCQSSDDSGTCNSGVTYRYHILQFCFKHTVKILH